MLVVAASGGGDLLVDVLTDLQGNILTRLYRNIQDDLTNIIQDSSQIIQTQNKTLKGSILDFCLCEKKEPS